MINRIFNLDAYDLIPLGLAVFFIGSFSFPAYNHLSYDANLKYAKEAEVKFSENLTKYQEAWYELGGDFESIEFNDFNILPNKDGYAGGEGISGTALNSYDCQNIFMAMTKQDYYIEIASLKQIESLSEETEFTVSYNEKNFVCSYTYIDKENVKRMRDKSTHIINYNTKTGESLFLKNGYTFK
jgi:hypothetical protein